MPRKRIETKPTTLDKLKQAAKEDKASASLYARVLAFRAALQAVRETFTHVDRAAEVAKATIHIEV